MGEHDMAHRAALVTGAGSGVGRAVALRLAAEGWSVALAGRRTELLKETAAQAGGAEMLVAPTDVGEAGQVDALFARTVERFGRLDLLFNNAGIGTQPVPVDELPVEDWLRAVQINLTGAFLCARAAFGQMRHQSPQGGRIINNGSISAHTPRPFSAPYTSTKHAITGLTKSLGLDGRRFNIAVGQVDIGNAATPMTERMVHGVLQPDGSTREEARMDVAHVADAVAYMARLPLDANVPFLTVMATAMPYLGRG
jgi:NAD(P)-dependent dehydrogenase (short-subunit alcohol dehydrogenase family)